MKKQMSILILSLLASSMSFSVQAEAANSAEEDIKTECREESKNAEVPEIYYEECVADKLQALKDQQGGGDAPVPAPMDDRG